MLELHYDLLEDDEAKQLRDAIATDPEVASEWAATLRVAGKLADAAKFESAELPEVNLGRLVKEKPSSNGSESSDDHPIIARVMESDSPNNRQVSSTRRASEDGPLNRARSWPWWASTSGLAATAAAIGMLVIGSWYFDRVPARPMSVIAVQAQAVPSHDRPIRQRVSVCHQTAGRIVIVGWRSTGHSGHAFVLGACSQHNSVCRYDANGQRWGRQDHAACGTGDPQRRNAACDGQSD